MGTGSWSTLAYLETVCVDDRGKVENLKMRCNPHIHPELHWTWPEYLPNCLDKDEYPTRLKDREETHHDDYSCLEDMIVLEMLRAWFIRYDDKPYEVKVTLTELGKRIANRLREHKMNGGTDSNFEVLL